jgi:anti-sigma factor RsiW
MSKDIQELLPFYVNGTLDDDEKDRVEQAIKDDPSLKDEIAYLEKLREEVKAQEIENSAGELGLKRLQKALAEERLKNDPIAQAKSKISNEQNWGWRVAAIAACLLLILQTAITMIPDQSGDLSAAGGPAITRTNGSIISVTFVPSAREENIRNLLLAIDANIVDGPSALGVYKISVSKDVAAALEKLRAHSTLIESADEVGVQ